MIPAPGNRCGSRSGPPGMSRPRICRLLALSRPLIGILRHQRPTRAGILTTTAASMGDIAVAVAAGQISAVAGMDQTTTAKDRQDYYDRESFRRALSLPRWRAMDWKP